MPSTFLSLHYHLVFSTKHRFPCVSPHLSPRLYAYLGGIVRTEGGQLLTVGGMPDHVHLLVRLGSARSLADVLRAIKAGSSKWVHETFPPASDFGWQTGYGAFTVSPSNLDVVRQYIEQQEVHHRSRSFQDEFRGLLVEHRVEFDERYLWD